MIKKSIKIIAIVLVLATCFITTAYADVQASEYIDSYNTYLYTPGEGKIEIWFDVQANTRSDEVGVLTVILKSSEDKVNWTTEETFRYYDYPEMLAYNATKYISHLEFAGETGLYYQAKVTIWVGNDGGGDSRIIYTPILET